VARGFNDALGLSQLLERLRRVRLPPGAAAAAVAVPSAGDELTGEVSFLFPELDAIEQGSQDVVSAARSEAVQIEAAVAVERQRLLDEARTEAERLALELMAEARARCEQRAQVMLADAVREADGVLMRGRARTPVLVEEVVQRMLESAR
jgi:vacuolar-type H+-ATPase subunit H